MNGGRCHKCNKFYKMPDAISGSDVVGHDWREAMDPATMQMYYYNTKTMETTWTRPEVMGPAPSATGWYALCVCPFLPASVVVVSPAA